MLALHHVLPPYTMDEITMDEITMDQNAMNEIIYWLNTRRAPCLMAYDENYCNILMNEEACCYRIKPKRVYSDKVPATKKRRRECNMVTSTPKVFHLRSSVHQAPQNIEIEKLLACGDQSADSKKYTAINKFSKSKNEVLYRQFENLTDEFDLSANYISCTILQSTKNKRVNNRRSRSLGDESKQKENESDNSSLVTPKIARKVKIIKSRPNHEKMSKKKSNGARTKAKAQLDDTYQSHKAKMYQKSSNQNKEISELVNQAEKNRNTEKNAVIFETRNCQTIWQSLRESENLVQFNNSTEQASSMVTRKASSSKVSRNVASTNVQPKEQKKATSRYLRSMNVKVNHKSKPKDSYKESILIKTGFRACFSESDEDSEPLKQRKFFIA